MSKHILKKSKWNFKFVSLIYFLAFQFLINLIFEIRGANRDCSSISCKKYGMGCNTWCMDFFNSVGKTGEFIITIYTFYKNKGQRAIFIHHPHPIHNDCADKCWVVLIVGWIVESNCSVFVLLIFLIDVTNLHTSTIHFTVT